MTWSNQKAGKLVLRWTRTDIATKVSSVPQCACVRYKREFNRGVSDQFAPERPVTGVTDHPPVVPISIHGVSVRMTRLPVTTWLG